MGLPWDVGRATDRRPANNVLYVWSLLLCPWLRACRAGVYTHTASLEALSYSWLPSGNVGYRSVGAFTHVSGTEAPRGGGSGTLGTSR